MICLLPLRDRIYARSLNGLAGRSFLVIQHRWLRFGVNSALGITPKAEDFIKEAARSDMLEIQAAKIAQRKGDADEKKFAEQMITDHSKTTSELERLVPSSKQLQATGRLDQQTVADLGLDSSRSICRTRRSETVPAGGK